MLCSLLLAVAVAQPAATREPLRPRSLTLLPLGAVEPRGWLRRQLRLQADGLTGHLDEFWPDVGPTSGWLGGSGESWERGPYFLDGLLPLAYLLDDRRLKAKAQKWIDWTLTHQSPEGWIGPKKNTDWWPNMVMLKVLTQYQEATGDRRVIPVMKRYFAHHLARGAERPLQQWASYRWGDELVSVLWLYDRTGDASLLELARLLHAQGTDWKRHFAEFEFSRKTTPALLGLEPGGALPDRAMRAHGVNNAMALKTSALWWLVSGDESDRKAVNRAFEMLDRHHGLPNGMFSGDEHYAGTDPSQGIELCAVVEALFSLQHVLSVGGEAPVADRLERIAFNALPAAFSSDMWAHQYDQQPNQVLCSLEPRAWVSNGPEANLFGLEPNFGCCTANLHQGWPKLVQSLWMATPDGGVAAVAYAPSAVRTAVAGGTRVTITEDTEYPFRGEVRLKVAPKRAVEFPLLLRIPAWAEKASVTVNGRAVEGVQAGAFARVQRRWQPGDEVVLTLPLLPRASTWHRDSVALERGPLVFALGLGEEWKKLLTGMKKAAPSPAADWEVHPTTAWNYGLVLDPRDAGAAVQVREKPVGENPFRTGGAPVELTVKGRRVRDWLLVDGSAGPLPQSPVKSPEPDETLTLVPYGSAKLRVTAFPRVEPR
jgi:glycosyl hydrolase family 127 (putative beta-L-arabinofuranosidase)/beta-L-arabinofuranosidase (glycosyl hydrolase family 127)